MTDLKNWFGTNSAKARVILRLLILLCVACIVWSAATLIANSREYARGDAAYEQVRTMLQKSGLSGGQDISPTGAGIDFEALRKVNPDVVGWLLAEGSIIDYPVVRGTDNDYYLTHLFNRQKNKLGALFVDHRNSGDFSDKNTIIYGHNMKDGSMFSSLTQYKAQSYYDNLPTMRLSTPEQEYTIALFAGIVADGSSDFVRFEFKDDADFLAYIGTVKNSSTFKSAVEVAADDHIVTLYTCSYEADNARYALFGKLLPAG